MTKSNINVLVGKTLSNVVNNNDEEIVFTTTNGEKYIMYSDEMGYGNDVDVRVEDICGELTDLVGAEIFQAEVSTNKSGGQMDEDGVKMESGTWTFYRFATIKGYVTIRWYGTSNGYYCEEVSFSKVDA